MFLNPGITFFSVFADTGTLSDTKPIKVLIVDDHAGVRAGIKSLLRMAQDILVIGEAANGAEAIEIAGTKKPDIVLLDVQLPDLRGDMVMLRIHDTQPKIKILAVSSFSDREYVQGMLENGASGYLTKDEAPVMLLDAIRSIIYRSKGWISPRAIKSGGLHSIEDQTLTEREIKILKQLLLDRSDNEIADNLGLDEKQVGRYLKLLMNKFEAETLPELKVIARRILHPRTGTK